MRDEASDVGARRSSAGATQAETPHPSSLPPHPSDSWIALSVATDEQFTALAGVLGLPALPTDERFVTLDARRRNHDALDAIIAGATRGHEDVSLERALQAAGVDASAVATPRDVWFDPQLKHRGFFELTPAPASAPEIGPRAFPRPGWKMSATRATTRHPAPDFGRHTREVLAEYLALEGDALESLLAELSAEGVIADAPRAGMVGGDNTRLQSMLASGLLREIDPGYAERLRTHLEDRE